MSLLFTTQGKNTRTNSSNACYFSFCEQLYQASKTDRLHPVISILYDSPHYRGTMASSRPQTIRVGRVIRGKRLGRRSSCMYGFQHKRTSVSSAASARSVSCGVGEWPYNCCHSGTCCESKKDC